jgi:hypothetical protein
LTDQQDSNDAGSPREPPIIPLGPWCISKIKRYFHERSAEREKETAQDRFTRRTANATVAIAVLAIVAAGVGALQYCTMQGQLNEMQAAQRPWIYAETPIFLKPITQKIVWEMRIEFKLQNTGHLPALHVTPIVQSPVPTINTGDIIASYQHAKCIDQNRDISATITGDTIFPGQIVKRAITIGIWPKDKAAAYTAINHYDPWIIGCFAYITSTSTLRHFTRFAYIVSQEAPDGGPASWLPYDPSNIQPDKIHVEPFLYKDSFAAD